jgi:Holliday junction DNA helicase RuvA
VIASLTGVVAGVETDRVIVDVGGVGYLVFASGRTLGQLPPVGGDVRLMIETHVREDHIHLYGFATGAEQDWFRLLTTVQGVGARVGLAILSVLTPEELTLAIAAQDRAALTRADGVGPKLATRILTELREKVDAVGAAESAAQSAGAGDGLPANDAVSALVNLGYGRTEAFTAVNRASKSLGDAASVETLITASLKELAA